MLCELTLHNELAKEYHHIRKTETRWWCK